MNLWSHLSLQDSFVVVFLNPGWISESSRERLKHSVPGPPVVELTQDPWEWPVSSGVFKPWFFFEARFRASAKACFLNLLVYTGIIWWNHSKYIFLHQIPWGWACKSDFWQTPQIVSMRMVIKTTLVYYFDGFVVLTKMYFAPWKCNTAIWSWVVPDWKVREEKQYHIPRGHLEIFRLLF